MSMQKVKIGKFQDKDKFFSQVFISGLPDFMPDFHFGCVAGATFDIRNLIHSADICCSVMACVGYARACS